MWMNALSLSGISNLYNFILQPPQQQIWRTTTSDLPSATPSPSPSHLCWWGAGMHVLKWVSLFLLIKCVMFHSLLQSVAGTSISSVCWSRQREDWPAFWASVSHGPRKLNVFVVALWFQNVAHSWLVKERLVFERRHTALSPLQFGWLGLSHTDEANL